MTTESFGELSRRLFRMVFEAWRQFDGHFLGTCYGAIEVNQDFKTLVYDKADFGPAFSVFKQLLLFASGCLTVAEAQHDMTDAEVNELNHDVKFQEAARNASSPVVAMEMVLNEAELAAQGFADMFALVTRLTEFSECKSVRYEFKSEKTVAAQVASVQTELRTVIYRLRQALANEGDLRAVVPPLVFTDFPVVKVPALDNRAMPLEEDGTV